ncbi:hypothetical protein CHISP_2622 [Chitinispirillum alkaliphilum]|nr:hypothetical protein CHISP_2622 [Chitinispirillum alkaliphilum]
MGLVILMLFLSFCSGKTGIAFHDLYTDPQFSGRDLSGADIVVGPVLMQGRPISAGNLESGKLLRKLRRNRSDLQLVSVYEFERSFKERHGIEELNLFYHNLFNSELLDVQSAQNVWDNFHGQFFFVTRVTNAASVRALDGSQSRRLRIEGELWRSDGPEVVWRAAVNVLSLDFKETDCTIIGNGIAALCDSLPQVQPGVGYREW